MLNVEKIRLMTELAIEEKHHGGALRDVAKYYRQDYISVHILGMILRYSIIFFIVALMMFFVDLENILIHVNLENLEATAHTFVMLYFFGLGIVVLLGYAAFSARYDKNYEESLYYQAKLDRLDHLSADQGEPFTVHESEAIYYKEMHGDIRVYDANTHRKHIVRAVGEPEIIYEEPLNPAEERRDDSYRRQRVYRKNKQDYRRSWEEEAEEDDFNEMTYGREDRQRAARMYDNDRRRHRNADEPDGGWLDE